MYVEFETTVGCNVLLLLQFPQLSIVIGSPIHCGAFFHWRALWNYANQPISPEPPPFGFFDRKGTKKSPLPTSPFAAQRAILINLDFSDTKQHQPELLFCICRPLRA